MSARIVDDCGLTILWHDKNGSTELFSSLTGNTVKLRRKDPMDKLIFSLDAYDKFGKAKEQLVMGKWITGVSLSEDEQTISITRRDDALPMEILSKKGLKSFYSELLAILPPDSSIQKPKISRTDAPFAGSLTAVVQSKYFSSKINGSSPVRSVKPGMSSLPVNDVKRKRITPICPIIEEAKRPSLFGSLKSVITNPVFGNGFVNSGNSCYVNSLLQVILRLPGFMEAIKDLVTTETHCTSALVAAYQHVLLMEAKETLQPYDASQIQLTVSGKLGIIAEKFSQRTQQDAHEFLVYLFDCLEMETGKTVIADWFRSGLHYKTQCNSCNYNHTQQQIFMEISLDLDSTDSETSVKISKLIEKAIKGNISIPDYKCEKCLNSGADQIVNVDYIGRLAVFHINRFGFSSTKRKDPVFVEPQITIRDANYILKGIVYHKGQSIDYGHYVSASLDIDGTWSEYNDTRVERMKKQSDLLEDVRKQREVCMVFYSKAIENK